MAAIPYTLAFIFDTSLEQVILITNIKPGWQQSKSNGVGGKLAPNESPEDAVLREITEETGLKLNPENLTAVGSMQNATWLVHLFAATTPQESLTSFESEEGQTRWHPVANLPKTVIDNLPWLIPLCKNKLQEGFIDTISIKYHNQTHE